MRDYEQSCISSGQGDTVLHQNSVVRLIKLQSVSTAGERDRYAASLGGDVTEI